MKIHFLKIMAVVIALVFLQAAFSACDFFSGDAPEPKPKPEPTTIAVTGVSLDKATISILVEGAETITASVSPKDASNKQVTWTSGDPTIAKIDNAGKVTGVKDGVTVITVTTADGNKTATCTVVVSVADDYINVEGFEDLLW